MGQIVSWNVNGLRSAARKGFIEWIDDAVPDVVCVQEIKVDFESLPITLSKVPGYHSEFCFSGRKGHAGVATYSRTQPLLTVRDVLSDGDADLIGRSLLTVFTNVAILNLYMPHGRRDGSQVPLKLVAYQRLREFIQSWDGQPLVLAGDFNIAHSDIDLARPAQNRRNVMFTGRERLEIGRLIELGFLDTFRHANPAKATYSWWPYRAEARTRNIGWRIDYIFVHESLAIRTSGATILETVMGSDHCPVSVHLQPGD